MGGCCGGDLPPTSQDQMRERWDAEQRRYAEAREQARSDTESREARERNADQSSGGDAGSGSSVEYSSRQEFFLLLFIALAFVFLSGLLLFEYVKRQRLLGERATQIAATREGVQQDRVKSINKFPYDYEHDEQMISIVGEWLLDSLELSGPILDENESVAYAACRFLLTHQSSLKNHEDAAQEMLKRILISAGHKCRFDVVVMVSETHVILHDTWNPNMGPNSSDWEFSHAAIHSARGTEYEAGRLSGYLEHLEDQALRVFSYRLYVYREFVEHQRRRRTSEEEEKAIRDLSNYLEIRLLDRFSPESRRLAEDQVLYFYRIKEQLHEFSRSAIRMRRRQ